METIIEEENRVVVEGTFVKSLDKDSNLQTFNEKELRTGDIILSFNVVDETGGLCISLRFRKSEQSDARKECNEFKNLLKPGMQLRLQGNVAPDRYNFDAMTMMRVLGIERLPDKEVRMDNAPEKRVELHCHTKMSKI